MKEAVLVAQRAGVVVRMVTGDHSDTHTYIHTHPLSLSLYSLSLSHTYIHADEHWIYISFVTQRHALIINLIFVLFIRYNVTEIKLTAVSILNYRR